MIITSIYCFLFIYSIFILYLLISTKDFKISLFGVYWVLFSISFLRWDIVSALGLIILLASLIISLFFLFTQFKGQSRLLKGLFAFSLIALILRTSPTLNSTNSGFDISPVFKGGSYLVIHGGDFSYLNHHHIDEKQKFAADIVKINAPFMTSRKEIFAKEVKDFHSFQSKIYSPCDGEVKEIIDNYPNEKIDSTDRDIPSNKIKILCRNNIYVQLLHLNQGSICCKTGDLVKINDYLSEIGNSGNSTEPHLHIQANDLNNNPIELTYKGFKLTRNFITF